MKKLLFLLLATTALAQTQTPQEASQAQTDAGVVGSPFYVSPRRLASKSGLGTVTSVGLSLPSGFTVTNSPVTTSGTLTATQEYLQLPNGSAPTTPTSAIRFFSDSSNRFSWIGTNGFTRTFDGTANTANRVYALPNVSGTMLADSYAIIPSTNTTGLVLYNTADQTTNTESAKISWTDNTFMLRTIAAGTGATRSFSLDSTGSSGSYARLKIDRAASPFFTFSDGGTSATRTLVNIAPASATNSQTSGSNAQLSITPTYNQTSSTAANTDLLINRTETAVGSGTQRLLDAQVGGTTMFAISNKGRPTLSATNTAGGTTGDQTINKPSGTVNFAAAATSLTVTNSTVTTASIVLAVVRTNDSTAAIKNVVPSNGSFVVTLTAAATAETSVGFVVFN